MSDPSSAALRAYALSLAQEKLIGPLTQSILQGLLDERDINKTILINDLLSQISPAVVSKQEEHLFPYSALSSWYPDPKDKILALGRAKTLIQAQSDTAIIDIASLLVLNAGGVNLAS